MLLSTVCYCTNLSETLAYIVVYSVTKAPSLGHIAAQKNAGPAYSPLSLSPLPSTSFLPLLLTVLALPPPPPLLQINTEHAIMQSLHSLIGQ